eukprot:159476-Pyramimonas_sp.AAC.1
MSSQALETRCFGRRRREETTAPSFVTPPATAAKPGDSPCSLCGHEPRPRGVSQPTPALGARG